MLRKFLHQKIVSNSQKVKESFSAKLFDKNEGINISSEITRRKKNGDSRIIRLKNRISQLGAESFPEFENKKSQLINLVVDLFSALKNSMTSEEEV